MKQYLNSDQTAKLIELGFGKPWRNEYLHILEEYGYAVEEARNFSIGELIEMLPQEIKVEKYEEPAYLQMLYDEEGVWEVGYTFYGNGMTMKRDIEFIDCLFQMCVKLKVEGVI